MVARFRVVWGGSVFSLVLFSFVHFAEIKFYSIPGCFKMTDLSIPPVSQSGPGDPVVPSDPAAPSAPAASGTLPSGPCIATALDRNKGLISLVRLSEWAKTVPFAELRWTIVWPGTPNEMHLVTYMGKAVMCEVRVARFGGKTMRYLSRSEVFMMRHVDDCTFDVDTECSTERLAKSPTERMAENRKNAEGLHRVYLSMYRPDMHNTPNTPADKETPAVEKTPNVKAFMNKQTTVAMKIRNSRVPCGMKPVKHAEKPAAEVDRPATMDKPATVDRPATVDKPAMPMTEKPIVPKRIDPPAHPVAPASSSTPAKQPTEQPAEQPSGLAVLIEAARQVSTESGSSSGPGNGSSRSGESSTGSDRAEESDGSGGSDKSWSPAILPANHMHPTQSGLRLSSGGSSIESIAKPTTAPPHPHASPTVLTPSPISIAVTNIQKALDEIKVTGRASRYTGLAIQMDRLTPRGQEMFRTRNSWFCRRSQAKSRGKSFRDKEPYTLEEIRNELLVLQPTKPAITDEVTGTKRMTSSINPHRNVATSAKRTRPDALDEWDGGDEEDEGDQDSDDRDEEDDAPATRSKKDMHDVPLLKVGSDKPEWAHKKAKK